MLQKLRNLIHNISMEAKPIAINAPAPKVLERHLGRLINLYQVRHPGGAVKNEIERRKISIAGFGHTAPDNVQEARTLMDKLGEPDNGNSMA